MIVNPLGRIVYSLQTRKNFDMKVFLAFQRVAFSDGVMETMMEKGNLDELFEEEQE